MELRDFDTWIPNNPSKDGNFIEMWVQDGKWNDRQSDVEGYDRPFACKKVQGSDNSYSGIVRRNNQISTIDTWGTEYTVTVDIIVHSVETESAVTGWSNILCFTSTDGDRCNFGDRAPAIWYHSAGFLRIRSARPKITDVEPDDVRWYYTQKMLYEDHSIDLNKWYTIEIIQEKKNGKFYYSINLNGEEIFYKENSEPQSFEDVKVFAGDNFLPASIPLSINAAYKNLRWITTDSENSAGVHHVASWQFPY